MSARALALLALLSACGDNNFHSADAPDDHADAPVVDDAPVSVDASLPDAAVPTDAPPFQLVCTLTDLQPLFTCAINSCAQDPSLTCLLFSCGLTLLTLPADCRTCLITAFTSQDIATTLAACGLGGLGGGLGGIPGFPTIPGP